MLAKKIQEKYTSAREHPPIVQFAVQASQRAPVHHPPGTAIQKIAPRSKTLKKEEIPDNLPH